METGQLITLSLLLQQCIDIGLKVMKTFTEPSNISTKMGVGK